MRNYYSQHDLRALQLHFAGGALERCSGAQCHTSLCIQASHCSYILLRPGQLRGTPVSGVTLTEGRWLHHMWCALVDSQVPDLSIRGAEVVRRMQDLARRLICEWTEDEVVKTFR